MIEKIKNIINKVDYFFYKKFGSDKSTKSLENIKEAQEVFSYLNEDRDEIVVRFVGGCVRKALNGENIDDIDLSTSLHPEEVKKILRKKHIRVIDTGIDHGTVTAILNKKSFEITTLREDIFTDGRHAKVQFTSNWTKDALRRDFTINAIYADINGRIFDPLNGTEDLKNGEIKFIGSTNDRIQEDYLRILRYIRFFAEYSKQVDHKKNIQYIKQNINGLNKVSNERIFAELKKILSLKNINQIFLDNDLKDIILIIFPQFKYYKRLKKLNNIDKKLIKSYDYKLILTLLILDETNDYDFFCYKYRISKEIKEKFINISKNFKNLKNKKFYSKQSIKKFLYLNNKKYLIDILLFSNFINSNNEKFNLKELLDYISNYKIPKFPISGNDLKKYGYESGEKLGQKLKFLESKWIENDFVLDKSLFKNL